MSQRTRVTLFCALCLSAYGLGIWTTPPPLSQTHPSDREPSSVQDLGAQLTHSPSCIDVVRTVDEWNNVTTTGRQVIFVDCDWHPGIAAFRRTFAEFAELHRQEADFCSVRVKTIAYADDRLSQSIEQFLLSQGIHPGGLKTLGGAGRVVWLEDGRVLHYEWWQSITDLHALQRLSTAAFEWRGDDRR